MNDKPEISIIIPIYNVEKYLEKCLKSVQNQSFDNFEALLINDGTKDNSIQIAEKFCDQDSRFHLINKKNGGQADSRNLGLKYANGEFIAFIDSDDYVHKDYLKYLYNACKENNADMSYCHFYYSYFKTGLILTGFPIPKIGVLEKTKALEMLIHDNVFRSYPWNKLYKRSLFIDNNIEFPHMFFEDIATSSRLLFHANRLAVTNKCLYYYVKRFGSTMSTMDMQKINDYLLSILILRNYIQFHGEYDKYKKALYSLSGKARFINIYSIIRQHILHLDFRKMKYNLDINKKKYLYIISDDYKATDKLPSLPYNFHQPGRKKKETL